MSGAATWAAAAVAAAALAGCSGGSSRESPRPIAGAGKQAAAAVERLDRAVRARDWATVCDSLFTAAARRRAGGRDCRRLLADSARGLSRPSIRILAIRLSGPRAQIRIRTRASGQRAIDETLGLRRSGAGYRIESLDG